MNPNAENCSAVFVVVAAHRAQGDRLEALLAGPTPEEEADGHIVVLGGHR